MLTDDKRKGLKKYHGITDGTVTASKALVVDSNKDLNGIRNLTISGNLVSGSSTLSTTEMAVLDGVTAGTVTASKAVVASVSKDISEFRNVGLSGTLTFGTSGAINSDSGTATASGTGTAGSATVDKMAGKVTTTSMTSASLGTYVLTINNSSVAAADMIFVSFTSASTGLPVIASVDAGSGTITITIRNDHPSTAFNATAVVSFLVIKA